MSVYDAAHIHACQPVTKILSYFKLWRDHELPLLVDVPPFPLKRTRQPVAKPSRTIKLWRDDELPFVIDVPPFILVKNGCQAFGKIPRPLELQFDGNSARFINITEMQIII